MEASVNKKKSSSSVSAKRKIEDEARGCPGKKIGRKIRKRNIPENKSAVEEYYEDQYEGGRIQKKNNLAIESKSSVKEYMKNLHPYSNIVAHLYPT